MVSKLDPSESNFSGTYPLKNTASSLVIMMPKVPANIIPVYVVLESYLNISWNMLWYHFFPQNNFNIV